MSIEFPPIDIEIKNISSTASIVNQVLESLEFYSLERKPKSNINLRIFFDYSFKRQELRFDIVILGYLSLIKKIYAENNTTIGIELYFKQDYFSEWQNKDDQGEINRLKHYAVFFNALFDKEIQSIYIYDSDNKELNFTKSGERYSNNAVVSPEKSYLPIILFDDQSFSSFFNHGGKGAFDYLNEWIEETWQPNKSLSHTLLLARINPKSSTNEYWQALTASLIWKILAKLRVQDAYAAKINKKEITQISGFKESQLNHEFFSLIEKRLTPLKSGSIVRILLIFFIFTHQFSSLCRKNKLSTWSTKEHLKKLDQIMSSIWSFTEDLHDSAREAAKNIINHSSSPQNCKQRYGALIARYYSESSQQAFKERVARIKDHSSTFEDDSTKGVWEINTIDLGKKNIKDTLIKSTQSKLETLDKKLDIYSDIYSDLEKLSDPNYTLDNFLNPENLNNKILNQQKIRYLCHFGLISFHSFVRLNNGIVIVKSSTIKNNKELNTLEYPEEKIEEYKVNGGTSVTCLIPFSGDYPVLAEKRGPLTSPVFENVEFGHLEEICDFNYIDGTTDSIINIKNNTIIDFEVNASAHRFNPDAILKSLEEKNNLLELLSTNKKSIISLHIKNSEIEVHSLFRLIYAFAFRYPKQTLIIKNITVSTLKKLIDSFQLYTKHYSTDLNNGMENMFPGSPVIIYSILESPINKKYKLTFTDVLYGKNLSEFRWLNHKVSRNNFNYTNQISFDENNHDVNYEIDLSNSLGFIAPHSLLPLDVLLKSEIGKPSITIFERNAYCTLNQEIISLK